MLTKKTKKAKEQKMNKNHKLIKKLILSMVFLFFPIVIFAEKSTISFKADSVKASMAENKKTTKLIGNAIVKVDNLEIKADSIEIFGTDYRFVNASGSVSGKDPEQGYTFKADFIKFDRKNDTVLMFGKIELKDTKNNVTITGENIEYQKKAEIMIMRFDVNIKKDDINCSSMFALYNRKESKLELTGKPSVKKGDDEFKAGKISVNLETEDISLDGRVSGTVKEEKEAPKKKKKIDKVEAKKKDVEKQEVKPEAPKETKDTKANKETKEGKKAEPTTEKTNTKPEKKPNKEKKKVEKKPEKE